MKHPVILLASLLILASCSHLGQESQSIGNSISFSASVLDGSTKATGEIGSLFALRQGGFGVFACYTGLRRYGESDVSSDYVHNQQVSWNGGNAWEYEPVKYWPNSADDVDELPHVSFFAYAPFSDGDSSHPSSNPAGYCVPSFCHSAERGDPWILYRLHPDPDKQVDLLYSAPLLDQTKPDTGAKLSFEFRHALACVGDKVAVEMSDALKEQVAATVPSHYDKVELILTNIDVT